MPIILDGTTGITTPGITNTGTFVFQGPVQVPAGTVGAPSVTTDGDTNTGIYFPAADTIGFAEGGVEALRINSSAQIAVNTAGTAGAPVITKTDDLNTGIFFPAADTIAFSEGGVEAMRLDSAGNVGIGTSSPAYRLDVQNSASTTWLRIGNAAINSGAAVIFNGASTKKNWVIASQYNVNGGLEFTQTTAGGGSAIGSTPAMAIDESGNLGLGVTPSGWVDVKALEIGSAGSHIAGYSAAAIPNVYVGTNCFFDGGNWKYKVSGYRAVRYIQNSSGEHAWFNSASGTAGNTITFTQAMTLTAAGNLGLGTTSPIAFSNYVAQTINGINGSFTEYQQNGGSTFRVGSDNSDGGFLFTQSAIAVRFGTNNVERARITSGGDFLLNTTTKGYGLFSSSRFTLGNGGAGDGFCVGGINENLSAYTVQGNNNTGTRYAMYIANGSSTPVGTISFTSAATAYNTSSDRRLKDNIDPADDAGAVIDAIEVVKHDWKVGGHTRYGMIAQDLYMVAPEAVTIGDSEDVETLKNPWGVDYSKLVPMLVKEIQSLRARLAAAGI